jgi:hypothetical protein
MKSLLLSYYKMTLKCATICTVCTVAATKRVNCTMQYFTIQITPFRADNFRELKEMAFLG